MRKFTFGVVLLLLLPLVCFLLSGQLSSRCLQLANETDFACQAILSRGNDDRADLTRCRQHWEKLRCFASAAIHHDRLEQIDDLFVQVEQTEADDFRLCCAQLSAALQALAQSQKFSLWNFL